MLYTYSMKSYVHKSCVHHHIEFLNEKTQDVSEVTTFSFSLRGLTEMWHQPFRNYCHFHTHTSILGVS